MVMQEQVLQAKKRLEEKWDNEGDCGSCGWHACLYEHHVEDWEIALALDQNKGLLELTCVSKDDPDDRYSHRGVRIFIGEAAVNLFPNDKGEG